MPPPESVFGFQATPVGVKVSHPSRCRRCGGGSHPTKAVSEKSFTQEGRCTCEFKRDGRGGTAAASVLQGHPQVRGGTQLTVLVLGSGLRSNLLSPVIWRVEWLEQRPEGLRDWRPQPGLLLRSSCPPCGQHQEVSTGPEDM
jgi:hypothetical protein